MKVKHIKTSLVSGDALEPTDTDILAQQGYLEVGLEVPEGWRVLTGNIRESLVVWIGYRYELGERKP